ncbi:MAG: arsenate reductase [Geobacteraceae bacterium GWC2_58_44]|nr:MAG: arsenate reductase [Geobacteraceae bacterium GWC2_58_44]HBG04016.1 arsenate reductase [Geobacter sp.]
MKKKVLFLCTHNSCRSQMAEGIVNADLGERFQAFSAGTVATSVNPLAREVLAEIGIDISGHSSKTLDQFADQSFDYVITLCGSANEQCPLFFGGVKRVHLGFDDPSQLIGSPEAVRADFRRVRDEIRTVITAYLNGEAR